MLRDQILQRLSERDLQLVEESWLWGNLLVRGADRRQPGLSGAALRAIACNWRWVSLAFLVIGELLPTIAVFAIILYGRAGGGELDDVWDLCWRIAAWLIALINLASVASLWNDHLRELIAARKRGI